MKTLELEKLTEEQLQAELERRQAAKKDAEKKAKEDYEAKRDTLVRELLQGAIDLNSEMAFFKNFAVNELEKFYTEAKQYGDVRSNSKGGFSLRSADGNYKVMLERNTKAEYDERADMAEALLREFLTAMVKKRDQQAYNIITALLQRGKDGRFNPAAVAALLKMEDDFNDERWNKAMKLFKESHNNILIAMNVSFYRKNSMGKDISIPLTFASLPVEGTEEETGDTPEEKL